MLHATIRLMSPALRTTSAVVCVTWIVILTSVAPLGFAVCAQAQAEPAAVWLDLVSDTRLDEGLDPYSQSRLLTQAAQRHADDLAGREVVSPDDVHRGSDGSSVQERIAEAGYAAWTEDGDQMVVAENVWSGRGTPEEALVAFLDDPAYRENLLSDAYREIGIGVAADTDGRSRYVLTFGARPNVLPIFINDGAASTENREVAIRLTNERVRPEGEGATFIGEAIEIRISNEPSFDELPWQSWAPLVSWLLPDVAGEHTVYVQFRDAAGRTAASADGIILGEGTPATSTVPPSSPKPSPQPTTSSSPTSESTATPEPSTSGDQVATTSVPATLPSEPPVSPTASAGLVVRATPFPTWTPLPSPEPTSPVRDDPDDPMPSWPNMRDYGRPLAAVGILQGVVVVLGIYWVMRRAKGR